MMTVFKKEMRLFFSHAGSYVLLGIMLLLNAVFFTLFNLIYRGVSLSYTLVYTAYAVIILAPIFTLRMFSREDRAAGELFLFSLPLSPEKICLGKFLALATQCTIGCSPILICPLILKPHGDFKIFLEYLLILLFLALLCLVCAICLLVFSVLRNKIAAFLVALFCAVSCFLIGVLKDLLPATALCALIGTLVLFALVALTVILISRRYLAAAVIFVLGLAISLVGFFALPASFGSAFSNLLVLLSPFERLNVGYFGLFDLAGAIFTLCFTAILVLCAILVWRSRRRMEDTPVSLPSSKPHKIFAAIVLSSIVLNMLFALLPAQARRISPSTEDMFHISDESVRFLGELGEDAKDVDMYFLTSDGKGDYQVYEFLLRYATKNPHLTLHTVNVTVDDSEVRDYIGSGISEHSILVKSSKRARVIDFGEMFYFYNWDSENYIGLGKIYPSQYDSYYRQYRQYFDNIPTVFCFEGDSLLTNAINYVTSDSVPAFYVLQGHGESELSMTVESYMTSKNCEVKYVNISAMDSLPSDCDTLIINAPQSDLSDEEHATVSRYLDGGGRLMVNKAYDLITPNLDSLLQSYGISQSEGLVCEGDEDLFLNQGQNYFPNYILGTPLDHPITSDLAMEARMIFLNSADIKIAESLPSGVTVKPFFVTSEISYRKLSDKEGDVSDKGACTLGVTVEADKGEGKRARIVYFACENVLNDIASSLTGGGNILYAESALSWLAEKSADSLTVSPRLVSGTLTVTRPTLVFWSILLVIIVPSTVIITGFVNRYKRRKK